MSTGKLVNHNIAIDIYILTLAHLSLNVYNFGSGVLLIKSIINVVFLSK